MELQVENSNLETSISTLDLVEQAFKKKQVSLQKQINELESAINLSFSQLQAYPYHLHAILVHDGTAESGHYYAFVYDRKNDYWLRFNDHKVSIEEESQVMKESKGGFGKSCAYGLVYIN